MNTYKLTLMMMQKKKQILYTKTKIIKFLNIINV